MNYNPHPFVQMKTLEILKNVAENNIVQGLPNRGESVIIGLSY